MDGSLKRGFSLTETMVAVALVAVALLGLMLVFTSGIALMGQSSELNRASETARLMMETIKQRGYSNIPVATFDGRIPTPPDVSGFPPSPYNPPPTGQKLVVRTQQLANNLKQVDVDVYWGERSQMTLETLVHP